MLKGEHSKPMTHKENLIETIEQYIKENMYNLPLPYVWEDVQKVTTTNTFYDYLVKEAFTIHTAEYLTFMYYSFRYYTTVLNLITIRKKDIPLLAEFIRKYIPTTKVKVNVHNVQLRFINLVYDMFQYCYLDNYHRNNPNINKRINFEEKAPHAYPVQYEGIAEVLNQLHYTQPCLPEMLHACNIPFEII